MSDELANQFDTLEANAVAKRMNALLQEPGCVDGVCGLSWSPSLIALVGNANGDPAIVQLKKYETYSK